MIINADSAQVYRDLRVFSARPSEAEEAQSPHRLYGYRDGAEACSAASWAEDAKAAIAEAIEADRLPILVGGTGLYLQTLLNGIAPVPAIGPEVRATVRRMSVADAFDALQKEDPEGATRLRAGDTTRVARALEVIRSTGQPLHLWQQEPRSGGIAADVQLSALLLLPPRTWLRERCDLRFTAMFSEEGLGEVRRLLDRRLSPELPVMRAIGVREAADYLLGRAERETALLAGQAATRRYLKRQYTWFRHQSPSTWARWEQPLETGDMQQALALLAASDC